MTIENHGILPTYILHSAQRLDWNESLVAHCDTERCTVDDGTQSRCQVGQVDGWGPGLFHDRAAFHQQRSRGNGHRRQLSWWIRGQGAVTLGVAPHGWGGPRDGQSSALEHRPAGGVGGGWGVDAPVRVLTCGGLYISIWCNTNLTESTACPLTASCSYLPAP